MASPLELDQLGLHQVQGLSEQELSANCSASV